MESQIDFVKFWSSLESEEPFDIPRPKKLTTYYKFDLGYIGLKYTETRENGDGEDEITIQVSWTLLHNATLPHEIWPESGVLLSSLASRQYDNVIPAVVFYGLPLEVQRGIGICVNYLKIESKGQERFRSRPIENENQ